MSKIRWVDPMAWKDTPPSEPGIYLRRERREEPPPGASTLFSPGAAVLEVVDVWLPGPSAPLRWAPIGDTVTAQRVEQFSERKVLWSGPLERVQFEVEDDPHD